MVAAVSQTKTVSQSVRASLLDIIFLLKSIFITRQTTLNDPLRQHSVYFPRARMSHFTDEPRFTIEQIDLLQRLRRTGMTKPEILHALDTLERLDREHGDKFNRSIPTSNTSSTTVATSSTTSTATQTQFPENLTPSPSNSYATSPPAILPSPVSLIGQNGREVLATSHNGKLSPNRYQMNSSTCTRSYGIDASEEDLDIDDKVEELLRRDSTLVKEEIKLFLGNRRISQAVVAQVTGISQSRISHWLLQQGSDLSEQKKRAFYRWYQLEKTTPGATLNMRPAPVSLDEMEWRQTPPPISSSAGSFRLRRGSRFTWRKECLAVMESYFSDNQYPDEAKREEISNACNAVIQKPGKKLSDLERVTSLKVYNWFANRRKEIKRRANIGSFFQEATILETHGIEVQSPGGHSNSDDVDAIDYDQGCEVTYFEKRGISRPFGYYRLDHTLPAQDDPTNHIDNQDPITLAVEMAAVNHSILALSRPGSGAAEIKTEVLEDD